MKKVISKAQNPFNHFVWRCIERLPEKKPLDPFYDMTDFPAYRGMMSRAPKDSPALDLGCGGGSAAFAFALNNIDGHAVDLFQKYEAMITLIDEFCSDATVTFERNSVADVEIPPDTYGSIVMSNIVHFISESQVNRLLEGVMAGIKPGGSVYICGFDTQDEFYEELNSEGSGKGLKKESDNAFVRHWQGRDMYAYFIDPDKLVAQFKSYGFEVDMDMRFLEGERYGGKTSCSISKFLFRKPVE